jgi:multiple sugar transport system substrate-binding protein
VGLVLAACSSGSPSGSTEAHVFSTQAAGTLSGWAFNNPDDVGTARLNYAQQKLSGLNIQLDKTGFDAQKFTTRLASGDVPDVVQMDSTFVATYAAQGVILPLDQCFTAHSVDPNKQWYPFVIGDVTYNGHVWGVPQFYQPPAIMVNKKLLNAVGVTIDQIDTSKPDVLLGAIAKMYKASGGVPTVLGFDPQAASNVGMWILGQGGKLTDAAGKPTLDNPANVAGLNLLKSITDAQGGYAKLKSFTDSFDFFGKNNQFVANQTGAELVQQWYPNVLTPYMSQIDIQAIPFKDKDGNPFSVTSGQAFVIPKAAKNPDAACAWALALTSIEAWTAAGQARADTRAKSGGVNTGIFTGSPEADQKIRNTWVKLTGNAGFDQVISTYYDVLGYGKTFGASPAGQDIRSELQNALTAVLLGQKPAQQALSDAQAAALQAYKNVTGTS